MFQKLNALNPEFTWIKDALDDSLENSVTFVDTGPVFNLMQKVPWKIGQKSDQSVNVDSQHENTLNIYEAAIVAKLVETLLQVSTLYMLSNEKPIFQASLVV